MLTYSPVYAALYHRPPPCSRTRSEVLKWLLRKRVLKQPLRRPIGLRLLVRFVHLYRIRRYIDCQLAIFLLPPFSVGRTWCGNMFRPFFAQVRLIGCQMFDAYKGVLDTFISILSPNPDKPGLKKIGSWILDPGSWMYGPRFFIPVSYSIQRPVTSICNKNIPCPIIFYVTAWKLLLICNSLGSVAKKFLSTTKKNWEEKTTPIPDSPLLLSFFSS